jgi:hypothetical protein
MAKLKKKKSYEYSFAECILIKAHKHCIRNKEEILSSDLCGCFYCLSLFKPDQIIDWLKEDEANTDIGNIYTALCTCGIDAVIGSASGFPITKQFMQNMHARWFSIVD